MNGSQIFSRVQLQCVMHMQQEMMVVNMLLLVTIRQVRDERPDRLSCKSGNNQDTGLNISRIQTKIEQLQDLDCAFRFTMSGKGQIFKTLTKNIKAIPTLYTTQTCNHKLAAPLVRQQIIN